MQATGGKTATRSEAIWAERERWVARGVSTYSAIVADRGHGALIWDVDGRRYIDFAGGIGTINAGHTPQSVVAAIRDQAEKLIHTCFSVAIYEPYVELARRLCEVVPGSFEKKAMLVNSGAEAVENAVKIARAATGREAVIAFRNGFHGRTLMGMSLTGRDLPYKEGFGPFAPSVYHAEFPYAYRCLDEQCAHNGGSGDCSIESGAAFERTLESIGADKVAAVIVEPVQGEGGFIVAPPRFLRRLREICDQEGILLIADEIQTGFARTGTLFAVEQSGVEPDLILLAKSLGAGLPIAAVVGRAEAMDAPRVGGIGGTFGGNPVACQASLAVLDLIEREDLPRRARHIGEIMQKRFEQMQQRCQIVGDVRGLGAMMAIELVRDRGSKEPATAETAEIMHACHDNGLLIIKAGVYDNVLRVLVPLVVTDEELNEGLDILDRAIADVAG
ncbi:MAG TPA: 4-aminobutyrate--2-oxoglutarate transaminase [Chloroflexota bacterium]|nr:4-aminobutyrate--2-oxoglutarate transaminase [Chloroflexota bacterium]